MSKHNFLAIEQGACYDHKAISDTVTLTVSDILGARVFVASHTDAHTTTLPNPAQKSLKGVTRLFVNAGSYAQTISFTAPSGTVTVTLAQDEQITMYCDGEHWFKGVNVVSTLVGGTLTDGKILIGSSANAAALKNLSAGATMTREGVVSLIVEDQALANGKVWVGNGANVAKALTPAGDVTITNAGATAIGAGKVTAAMAASEATVDDAVIGIAVHLRFTMGNATATKKFTVPAGRDFFVDDAWVVKITNSADAGDKVKVTNVGNAITDDLVINIAANTRKAFTTYDPAYRRVVAGTELRVTATDVTNPDCYVYVIGHYMASA